MKYGNSIDRGKPKKYSFEKRDPKYLVQNVYTYHTHRISDLPDFNFASAGNG